MNAKNRGAPYFSSGRPGALTNTGVVAVLDEQSDLRALYSMIHHQLGCVIRTKVAPELCGGFVMAGHNEPLSSARRPSLLLDMTPVGKRGVFLEVR